MFAPKYTHGTSRCLTYRLSQMRVGPKNKRSRFYLVEDDTPDILATTSDGCDSFEQMCPSWVTHYKALQNDLDTIEENLLSLTQVQSQRLQVTFGDAFKIEASINGILSASMELITKSQATVKTMETLEVEPCLDKLVMENACRSVQSKLQEHTKSFEIQHKGYLTRLNDMTGGLQEESPGMDEEEKDEEVEDRGADVDADVESSAVSSEKMARYCVTMSKRCMREASASLLRYA